ncbi:MAG TPA: choice-of-anchor R domain-containing protein [bacterium]|nr:choice-of-anchor R domain-containing protein [bacterium]
MRTIAAGILVLAFAASPAAGQCTLSTVESQTDSTHSWVHLGVDFEAAQTFTLGTGEGGSLDSVTVHLSRVNDRNTSGMLELRIHEVDGSGEPATQLASEGPVPFGQVPAAKAGFRFTTPATVTENTSYALVLKVTGTDPTRLSLYVRWAGSLTDTYAGGSFLTRDLNPQGPGIGPWQHHDDVDRHFEIHVCQ